MIWLDKVSILLGGKDSNKASSSIIIYSINNLL